jgi:hypothetical protein
LTNVVVRPELMRGLGRLNATTTVLQRARLAEPLGGMWEAADVQWWWRRPRATDELALPVWFDEVGPLAAAGLTACGATWQADASAVASGHPRCNHQGGLPSCLVESNLREERA